MTQIELHRFASENRVDKLKCLLDQKDGKVHLEDKNDDGETALHAAAKNGCDEAVKMLLDYGAKVDATTNVDMKTPLHLAVDYALQSGKNSVVETLLEYNADCRAVDKNGDSIFNRVLAYKDLLLMLSQNYLTKNPSSQMSNTYQNYLNEIKNTTTKPENQINEKRPKECLEEAKNDGCGIKGNMDEFEDELSKIVGLHDLKLQFRTWAKGLVMDKKRRAMGANLGPRKLPHMVFLGNPGTGKTTVARILGKLLQSIGVLSSDKVIEVQRSDLVGEYIGQTGLKTRKTIKKAMGGTLFVDEAYRLAIEQESGSHQDFGVEALEEIMSVLDDGKTLVIFAGYGEPMQRLFSSNKGFRRRVTRFFQFDDFTCKDLAEMLMLKMSKLDVNSRLYGFKLDPSCTGEAAVQVIENNSTKELRSTMNGGLVDEMLNNARENLDLRLKDDSEGDELLTITLSDLEAGLKMLVQRINGDDSKRREREMIASSIYV